MPKGEDFTADYYVGVPQAAGGKFPLIILNPGYTSYVEAHTFLSCELASHGYIMGRVPVWAEDTLCAVRALKERCADRIDFSRGIGATGHSMGGAVAYYLCQHEEEFCCGINIDGGLFGDYEGMVMKKPFLQICCKDNLNVTTRPLFGTEAFVRREVFEDMKHLGFADAKFMIPMKSAVGKLDGVTMHKRLVACHFELFDRYLKRRESACGK